MKAAPPSLGSFFPKAGLHTDAFQATDCLVLRKQKYHHLRIEEDRNPSTDVLKAAWLLKDLNY